MNNKQRLYNNIYVSFIYGGVPMTTAGFFKGMIIGAAAGACLGAVVMPKKKKIGKKMMGKTLKAAGELIDNFAGTMWG